MKTVLDIHGLSKNFDKQAILQDLHLTIREGDIYGLIGKNGAGKTTFDKKSLRNYCLRIKELFPSFLVNRKMSGPRLYLE